MNVQIQRVYDPAGDDDGYRVLVDRLWPRGVSKERAQVDLWAKELAPSTALRKWFSHDPAKFDEFRSRYLEELDSQREQVAALLAAAKGRKITLLFAARDRACNQAVVLREYLLKQG